MIVEGMGTATREVDGDGSNGLCRVSSHTQTTESYEYGCGKGLAVVFKRFRGVPHSGRSNSPTQTSPSPRP